MPRTSDKREKLVKAGERLFHRRGIERSTLADLATESGVPLGNIYYYFKTKEDLIVAVAEQQRLTMCGLFDRLEKIAAPDQRLLKFIDAFEGVRDERAAYGCPVGNLCQEANKAGGEAAPRASAVFQVIVDWLERQFIALGCARRRSRANAIHILSMIQGSSLVAHTFGDPDVVRSEVGALRRWLEEEVAAASPGGKQR